MKRADLIVLVVLVATALLLVAFEPPMPRWLGDFLFAPRLPLSWTGLLGVLWCGYWLGERAERRRISKREGDR